MVVLVKRLNKRQFLLIRVKTDKSITNIRKVILIYHLFLDVQLSQEEEEAIRQPILAKYEKEGHPYYSSAR